MGERVLIDTDSLIDYYKDGAELEPSDTHHVSEVTVYEFIRGTKDMGEAKKMLEQSFLVIWLDNRIVMKAGEIWRALKAKGESIDDRDLMIGATAIVEGLKLLTRNAGHYAKLREHGLVFY